MFVCVFIGGPADGKLVPGDQLFKINNIAVDDLSTEQAADIIRYATCKSVYVKLQNQLFCIKINILDNFHVPNVFSGEWDIWRL